MALAFEPVVLDGPEPVMVEHRMDHKFVERAEPAHGELAELDPYGDGPAALRMGSCALCGRGKGFPAHHGSPGSLRAWGSGSNHRAYQAWKRAWQDRLTMLLEDCDLPRPCRRVTVEGVMCFGTRPSSKGPDQGNFRAPLEKVLGDALEEGGWLLNDNWLSYSFGNLEHRHVPGEWWTRLVLFPEVGP